MEMEPLGEDFFRRNTLEVAPDLLGTYLVRQTESGPLVCQITETEAYIGAIDKACHAYGNRRTPRTETLYGPPGTSYVYLIYGMYHCLNFITEEEGVAAGVLIRGGVPAWDADGIAQNRYGRLFSELTPYQRRNLLNGPGKLCKGLCIDRSFNQRICGDSSLYICQEIPSLGLRAKKPAYTTGPRIGVDYAEEARFFPWRFLADETIEKKGK